MRVIDHPLSVESCEYELAIARMVSRLMRLPGVVSVYQIGDVSNPGISDIDLVVVFKDDQQVTCDPRKCLNQVERYLFPHALFGINRGNFAEAWRYGFFHNYRLLTGEPLHAGVNRVDEAARTMLQRQVAIEYLYRMYINMVVEKSFRIVKLRNLLLKGRALSYDLDFLAIDGGVLFDLVQRVISWRNHWFDRPVSERRIIAWFVDCFAALEELLNVLLTDCPMWLLEKRSYRFSRNIHVTPGEQLEWCRRGLVIPGVRGVASRPAVKVLHRFNQFHFTLPMCHENVPVPLEHALAYQRRIREYNTRMLPQFMTLTSSLNLV